MPQKTVLKKTPRTVIYTAAIAGAVLVILAVISELAQPGSVQRVAEATDTVVVQVAAILASLAVLAGPVLSLLNLSDDDSSDSPVE